MIKKRCIGCNRLRIIAKKKKPPPFGTLSVSMRKFYDDTLLKNASSFLAKELLPAERNVSSKIEWKKIKNVDDDIWHPEGYTLIKPKQEEQGI